MNIRTGPLWRASKARRTVSDQSWSTVVRNAVTNFEPPFGMAVLVAAIGASKMLTIYATVAITKKGIAGRFTVSVARAANDKTPNFPATSINQHKGTTTMNRNVFGEPRPANSNEIAQALDELLIDPSTVMVIVDEEDNGHFAEVIGEDDKTFTAGPFDNRAKLDAALAENGIEDFD